MPQSNAYKTDGTQGATAKPEGTRNCRSTVWKREVEREEVLRRGAARAVHDTVRAGAERYDRARHLPRLIRAVPGEIEGDDPATGAAIVARLTHALAAERRRARSGHWSYDLNRHIALMQALAAERARLCEA